ncbi:hypothetical protein D3C86_1953670 [compost metagenome]
MGDDVEVFIKDNGIQLPILVEEYIEGDVVYTVEAVSYNKKHSILAISAEIFCQNGNLPLKKCINQKKQIDG